jgi:hypothetical protein
VVLDIQLRTMRGRGGRPRRRDLAAEGAVSPFARLAGQLRQTQFLVVIDQQFGAPIQLIGGIEQIFGHAVRCQARQQHAANPEVYFGAQMEFPGGDETENRRCCGMEVHKETVVVCVKR